MLEFDTLSYSMLQDLEVCAWKYYVRWVKGCKLPYSTSDMVKGILVHELIEDSMNGQYSLGQIHTGLEEKVEKYFGHNAANGLKMYFKQYDDVVKGIKQANPRIQYPKQTKAWKEDYARQFYILSDGINKACEREKNIILRAPLVDVYEEVRKCTENFLIMNSQHMANYRPSTIINEHATWDQPVELFGHRFNGKLDRIEFYDNGSMAIFDYKTGRYCPSENDITNNNQLWLYVFYVEAAFGIRPNRIGIWSLLDGNIITVDTTEEQYHRMYERIKAKVTYKNRLDELIKKSAPLEDFVGLIGNPKGSIMQRVCQGCAYDDPKLEEGIRCPW